MIALVLMLAAGFAQPAARPSPPAVRATVSPRVARAVETLRTRLASLRARLGGRGEARIARVEARLAPLRGLGQINAAALRAAAAEVQALIDTLPEMLSYTPTGAGRASEERGRLRSALDELVAAADEDTRAPRPR